LDSGSHDALPPMRLPKPITNSAMAGHFLVYKMKTNSAAKLPRLVPDGIVHRVRISLFKIFVVIYPLQRMGKGVRSGQLQQIAVYSFALQQRKNLLRISIVNSRKVMCWANTVHVAKKCNNNQPSMFKSQQFKLIN